MFQSRTKSYTRKYSIFRQRQENYEFWASLDYTVKLCLRNKYKFSILTKETCRGTADLHLSFIPPNSIPWSHPQLQSGLPAAASLQPLLYPSGSHRSSPQNFLFLTHFFTSASNSIRHSWEPSCHSCQ